MRANPQAAPDYDAIIGDPLFKVGYNEVFDGEDIGFDVRWGEAERLAYGRGRSFGQFVLEAEGQRLPLHGKSFIHPAAKHLLMRAMARGEVT